MHRHVEPLSDLIILRTLLHEKLITDEEARVYHAFRISRDPSMKESFIRRLSQEDEQGHREHGQHIVDRILKKIDTMIEKRRVASQKTEGREENVDAKSSRLDPRKQVTRARVA